MDTIQIDNFLKELNFTDAERKIIIELAYREGYSIGEIIKKTGLHRGTTYNTLQRLKEKGVIGLSRDYNCKGSNFKYILYSNAFLSGIIEKKKKLEEKEKFAREFIKISKKIPKISEKNEEPEVISLSGINSYKNFFINRDLEAGNSDRTLLYIGRPGVTLDYISKDFENFHMNLKKESDILTKAILINYNRNKDHPVFDIIKNTKVKWLNKELNINTDTILLIHKNTFSIVDFNVKPIKIIQIKDKNIVNLQKELFNILWNDSSAVSSQEFYN